MFPVQLYRLDRRGSSILNEYTKIRQWNFDRKQYLCSASFSFLFPFICLSFAFLSPFFSILLSYFPMICFSFLVLPSFYALRQLLCSLTFTFFYTFCFLEYSRVNHIDKKVGKLKFPCSNESIFRFCIYLISTLNSVIFNK